MKRLISISLFIFLFFYYIKAQDFKPFNVTYMDNPYPGYLFITPHYLGMFYLVDNAGEPIYKKDIEKFNDLNHTNLQINGYISFFSGNKFFIMNKDYDLVDSFSCVGNYNVDFHDFLLLPNGNTVLIGVERRFMDLSKTVPGGQENASVEGNIIQEIDMNKNVVFQWSSFDHFQLTDVTTDIDLKQFSIVSCHMNSIFYDTDNSVIISSRSLDEVTKIDKSTGNIIWRLGGKECKNNQFRFLNDTVDGFYGFSHQHSITRLLNGNLLLFDNGNLKPNPKSRAVEYKLDETNKTIEKVWEYSHNPEIYSQAMGNAQRLPNGNTLIGWGINPSTNLTATEVKPDGTNALEIAGYENYTIYKYIYKMHAVTLDIDKTGSFGFDKDTNETDVKIIINSLIGTGNISVAKHFYQPHNLEFSGKIPTDISKDRWTISHNGIDDISATIKFNIDSLSLPKPEEAIVYFRSIEGKGRFYPLQTTFDQTENCIEINYKGTGEFILCNAESTPPLTALYPGDSAIEVETEPTLIWYPMPTNATYRIQLSDTIDFSTTLIDTSMLPDSWLPCNLNQEEKYFWRVKAKYGNEESEWSKTYMFSTLNNNELLPPELLFPHDRDTSVPVSGVLRWEKVPKAISYNIEIALDPNFLMPYQKFNNVDSNFINYFSLKYGIPHFWHVSSSNGKYTSPWSNTWMFVTDKEVSVDNENNLDDKLFVYSIADKLSFIVRICDPGAYKLNLYDLRGNKVTESNAYCDGNNDLIFNINNTGFNSGFYFYRILSKDKTLTGKLLIQK